jgi:hypothetical protein
MRIVAARTKAARRVHQIRRPFAGDKGYVRFWGQSGSAIFIYFFAGGLSATAASLVSSKKVNVS